MELKISLSNLKELLKTDKFKIYFDMYDEDDELNKAEDLRNLINEEMKQYDMVVNWYDFDFDRIYIKGYNDSNNWDDYYIMSFTFMYYTDEKGDDFIGVELVE